MKLFNIGQDGRLIPFKEHVYSEDHFESDLETLLENNPEYFFDHSKVLTIGRQIATNLGSYIDLLGLDKYGNTVVVELKRGKTPRETLAQLLEYASYVENLDYESLNEIFQAYAGEEIPLEDYHSEFFRIDVEEKVSFNKSAKLVIVAQDVANSVKQTSLYLRRKGLDIYCMEFKYFLNRADERMITSDFVVGEENFIKRGAKLTTQLPKVDEKTFLESLDNNGREAFEKLFAFAKNNGLMFRWGYKGFSLNVSLENGYVGLCFGYPPGSDVKQSIYCGFEQIIKKVEDGEEVANFYKDSLKQTGFFQSAKSSMKWLIKSPSDAEHMETFLRILNELIEKINTKGLKD